MGSGITGSRGRRPEGGGRPPHPIARRRSADGLLAAQQKEQGGNDREAAERSPAGLQPAAVNIRPADEPDPAPASHCSGTTQGCSGLRLPFRRKK